MTHRYDDAVHRLWVRREIAAPPAALWELLTDTNCWSRWGPSVRSAQVDGGRLEAGAKGTVTTALGLGLPFEITDFGEGTGWSWKVAGIAATDHTVEPLGPDRCRVGFGVPWPAAPYLAVCRVALRRLEAMATNMKEDA